MSANPDCGKITMDEANERKDNKTSRSSPLHMYGQLPYNYGNQVNYAEYNYGKYYANFSQHLNAYPNYPINYPYGGDASYVDTVNLSLHNSDVHDTVEKIYNPISEVGYVDLKLTETDNAKHVETESVRHDSRGSVQSVKAVEAEETTISAIHNSIKYPDYNDSFKFSAHSAEYPQNFTKNACDKIAQYDLDTTNNVNQDMYAKDNRKNLDNIAETSVHFERNVEIQMPILDPERDKYEHVRTAAFNVHLTKDSVTTNANNTKVPQNIEESLITEGGQSNESDVEIGEGNTNTTETNCKSDYVYDKPEIENGSKIEDHIEYEDESSEMPAEENADDPKVPPFKIKLSDIKAEPLEESDQDVAFCSKLLQVEIERARSVSVAERFMCSNFLEVELKEDETQSVCLDNLPSDEKMQLFPTHTPGTKKKRSGKTPRPKREVQTEFNCSVCFKSFPKRRSLNKHKRIHRSVKPYVCQVCNKSFIQRGDLTKHYMTHTGLKPFACEICPRAFVQRTDLVKHMYIHDGVRPFKCEICAKAYTQNSHLVKHMLVHCGPKPHKCAKCNKTFINEEELAKHATFHVREKKYVCQICNKKYTQPTYLSNHMMIHTGDQPHQCESCMKRFTHKSDLVKHMIVHVGTQTMFTCEVCNKSFKEKCKLTKHINSSKHVRIQNSIKKINKIKAKVK